MLWSECVLAQGPFALLVRNGAQKCGSLTLWVGQSPGIQLQAPLPQEGGTLDPRSALAHSPAVPALMCLRDRKAGRAAEGTEGDVLLPLSSCFISSIHASKHNC